MLGHTCKIANWFNPRKLGFLILQYSIICFIVPQNYGRGKLSIYYYYHYYYYYYYYYYCYCYYYGVILSSPFSGNSQPYLCLSSNPVAKLCSQT